MSTLKDVAALAGVSLTTVSIVANGKAGEKHISPATVERVLAAIEQLGYRPNRSAQLLRSRSSRAPVVAYYWPLDYRTNLLGGRLANLQSVLREREARCELVVQTYENGRLGEFLLPLRTGRYDGAIVAGASRTDLDQLEAAALALPLVLVNAESRRYSTVGVDHVRMGMQAAALLHRRGHRVCALVKTDARYAGTDARTRRFLEACAQLGVSVPPELTFAAPATIAGGAAAAEEFCVLSQRPAAIFFESDCMAQGGVHTLHRMGLRVPEDVEVLCYGMQEPETMQYLTPSISCVAIPPGVDKQAMSMMLRLLSEPEAGPLHAELEPLVQLRDSFPSYSP